MSGQISSRHDERPELKTAHRFVLSITLDFAPSALDGWTVSQLIGTANGLHHDLAECAVTNGLVGLLRARTELASGSTVHVYLVKSDFPLREQR